MQSKEKKQVNRKGIEMGGYSTRRVAHQQDPYAEVAALACLQPAELAEASSPKPSYAELATRGAGACPTAPALLRPSELARAHSRRACPHAAAELGRADSRSSRPSAAG